MYCYSITISFINLTIIIGDIRQRNLVVVLAFLKGRLVDMSVFFVCITLVDKYLSNMNNQILESGKILNLCRHDIASIHCNTAQY